MTLIRRSGIHLVVLSLVRWLLVAPAHNAIIAREPVTYQYCWNLRTFLARFPTR